MQWAEMAKGEVGGDVARIVWRQIVQSLAPGACEREHRRLSVLPSRAYRSMTVSDTMEIPGTAYAYPPVRSTAPGEIAS
ncbi:hypothetical protein V5799_007045 [Amblyomma americanum]|uniref:Uncharacterized protein n=1 Tax=Amblyomma americanum TaxID=6943 RepID=A0AAQ4DUN5_AMBAM